MWVPGIELPSPGLHSERFAHWAVSPLHLTCLLIESCAFLQTHHQAPTGCWLLSGRQDPPSKTQTDPWYRSQRMKKAAHTSERLLGGSKSPCSHDNMTSPSTKLTLENHPSYLGRQLRGELFPCKREDLNSGPQQPTEKWGAIGCSSLSMHSYSKMVTRNRRLPRSSWAS